MSVQVPPPAIPYHGPDRRQSVYLTLTDEQIEHIADKAAAKAVEQMTATAYQSIGRGVVSKATWLVGLLAAAAYLWAAKHGLVPIPGGK